MVEGGAKYTAEWADTKCADSMYVVIKCKEEGNQEEGQAPTINGYCYDQITTSDPQLDAFPHEVDGFEGEDGFEYATLMKAMEYLELVNTTHAGVQCECPPPLKKVKSGNHLQEFLENDKTKGEMGHWWAYISTCDDDLLLKVLAVANKLNCESLMRLCSARTCDRIYNCSVVG